MICQVFDLSRDVMITPKKIQYAEQQEKLLYNTLLEIATDKQAEIAVRVSISSFRFPQSVLEAWGSIPGPVKLDTVSPTIRHRCDVSSELCCPGAKPRRWAPPPVTRFGMLPRV